MVRLMRRVQERRTNRTRETRYRRQSDAVRQVSGRILISNNSVTSAVQLQLSGFVEKNSLSRSRVPPEEKQRRRRRQQQKQQQQQQTLLAY